MPTPFDENQQGAAIRLATRYATFLLALRALSADDDDPEARCAVATFGRLLLESQEETGVELVAPESIRAKIRNAIR